MKDYSKELKDLILTTIKEGASDLHITAGRHPTIRVSGSLIPLLKKSCSVRRRYGRVNFVYAGRKRQEDIKRTKRV